MGEDTSRWVRATGLILLGLVAAWSWLFVVSRWGPAQRIDILTFKAGLTSKVMRALLKPAEETGHHHGQGHDHDAVSLSGIYATPEYYALTEQTRDAAKYRPEQFAVFYLFEDLHVGELPASPPDVTLHVDEESIGPTDRTVIRDSPHHRVTVVRFPRQDSRGQPLIADNAASLDLMTHQPDDHSQQVMQWKLPIVYPHDLKEADLSLPTLLALLAGLLAVLSPCLLQLTVYYTFALTGLGMQQGTATQSEARAQVFRSALYFIAGFTIVFTAVGSLAGLTGQRLESSGIIEAWSRPLSIAAGIGILLMGLRVAIKSDASGVCRLPLLDFRRAESRSLDTLRVMFMGSAFAVGCSTCFGGALFMSLMIYVGTVGSASLGALALFVFSLGIAIPYLLAAFFLSRALPLLRSLQRVASGVGLVCSVVLIFFGVILITDNFHIPSNVLYRLYLGL